MKTTLLKYDNFPYGKASKTLKKAVSWLNKNRKRLAKEMCDKHYFDYPDYWGMPKAISSRLSSDDVDWLQGDMPDDWFQKHHEECSICYSEVIKDDNAAALLCLASYGKKLAPCVQHNIKNTLNGVSLEIAEVLLGKKSKNKQINNLAQSFLNNVKYFKLKVNKNESN